MQVIESISSLLLGLWMLTGVTLSDGTSPDLSYCQKKDSYQFNADGTFESKKHFLKGTTCKAFPVKGKYRLSKNEKQIDLYPEESEKDKLSMMLVKGNDHTLKLKIKDDIVTLRKAGTTPLNSSILASPEILKGKWSMIENTMIEGELSDCDKKSFMQFNVDGTMIMGISMMKNDDCKTKSETVSYHVTTDLAFLVIEPAGKKAVAMKMTHLKENQLTLEMGGGKVTFKKE